MLYSFLGGQIRLQITKHERTIYNYKVLISHTIQLESISLTQKAINHMGKGKKKVLGIEKHIHAIDEKDRIYKPPDNAPPIKLIPSLFSFPF